MQYLYIRTISKTSQILNEDHQHQRPQITQQRRKQTKKWKQNTKKNTCQLSNPLTMTIMLRQQNTQQQTKLTIKQKNITQRCVYTDIYGSRYSYNKCLLLVFIRLLFLQGRMSTNLMGKTYSLIMHRYKFLKNKTRI